MTLILFLIIKQKVRKKSLNKFSCDAVFRHQTNGFCCRQGSAGRNRTWHHWWQKQQPETISVVSPVWWQIQQTSGSSGDRQRANISGTEPELHRFFMHNTWRTHTGRTSTTVIYTLVVRGHSNHQVEPVRTINWQPPWIIVQCFRGPIALLALLYSLIVSTNSDANTRNALECFGHVTNAANRPFQCVTWFQLCWYLKTKMVPSSNRKKEPKKGAIPLVCRNCHTAATV